MGMYKYIGKLWKSDEQKAIDKTRLIAWRKEPVFLKIERPTRLDKARKMGYKAKQGFVLVRTSMDKGTRKREKYVGGRKPLRAGLTKHTPRQSHQHIMEMRVAKKYPNMEVLNSYYVAEDGRRKWYEVILVDPDHPVIKSDPSLNWIMNTRGRVFRGLTAAGKSSRMLGRGKGFERKNTIKK